MEAARLAWAVVAFTALIGAGLMTAGWNHVDPSKRVRSRMFAIGLLALGAYAEFVKLT